MERIRCPNPKCGRHIFDIEEMPPGRTVLEIKCRRCGEVVEVGFGPKMVHKKNRRQGYPFLCPVSRHAEKFSVNNF